MGKTSLNLKAIRNHQMDFICDIPTSFPQNQMTQSRRFWTLEQDQTLTEIVENMETLNWTLAAAQFSNVHPSSNRNSKQCRQRWVHHISILRNARAWTVQEQKMMVELFLIHHCGKNKWKAISEALSLNMPRQPTEVKNRFYALIRRGLRRINNHLGRQIKPQQIRILKPSTISSLIENSNDQNSQKLVKIIYQMATRPVEEENAIKDKQALSGLLNKIISHSNDKRDQKNTEEKQNITSNVQQISKRKYSVETATNDLNISKEDLKSSTKTLYDSQELQFPEQDIGCFLNIEQVDSPLLEFEEFFLPF